MEVHPVQAWEGIQVLGTQPQPLLHMTTDLCLTTSLAKLLTLPITTIRYAIFEFLRLFKKVYISWVADVDAS